MKGLIIDCDYLIKVKYYMYPRPKQRKIIINHGEKLPIIMIGL